MKIMACGFFASVMRVSDGKNGFLKIFWMNIFFVFNKKNHLHFQLFYSSGQTRLHFCLPSPTNLKLNSDQNQPQPPFL